MTYMGVSKSEFRFHFMQLPCTRVNYAVNENALRRGKGGGGGGVVLLLHSERKMEVSDQFIIEGE